MFIITTTAMAIIGALCVARNKALIAYNDPKRNVEHAAMFAVFSLVAWYGVYNLRSG